MRTPLGPSYLVSQHDPLFPPPFCDLADPPAKIQVVGQLPDWSQTVAVVGTRESSARSAQLARALGRELAEAGRVVVSGGALGIDAEAHWGAIEAGGITVVVLATPLDRLYPRENTPLFRAAVERGCVLSELSAGDPVCRARFIQRNRLIAALAKITIVVQAPYESGALSTAAVARKLNRPLLAVPHAPWDAGCEGGVDLLAQGAGICRDTRDVLLLSAAGPQKRSARKRPQVSGRPEKVIEYQGLDEDERAVVEALLKGPAAADEVCDATGLPAPRVQRAILMLLLSKVIQEVGSGRYARSDYR